MFVQLPEQGTVALCWLLSGHVWVVALGCVAVFIEVPGGVRSGSIVAVGDSGVNGTSGREVLGFGGMCPLGGS